jgi:hypothetical protein
MTYVSPLIIPGLLVFLLLQPKIKALISFFLMMQCFDLAPSIMYGMYVWDYAAILMLVTGVEVFLRKPIVEPAKHSYVIVLKLFIAWLLICFVWSLVVYQYPLMHTIKSARYVVLGYSMTLIFIRLFSVQPDSFEFFMNTRRGSTSLRAEPPLGRILAPVLRRALIRLRGFDLDSERV